MQTTGAAPVRVEPDAATIRRTFRWDLLRGSCQGILETVQQTFALVIAIRYFETSETLKPYLTAGTGLGLMLGPFLVPLLARLPISPSQLASLVWLVAGMCMAGAAIMTETAGYVVMMLGYQVISALNVPTLTQLLSANYPSRQLGQRLAASNLMLAICGVGAALVFGRLLDASLGYYRVVLAIAAVAAWVGAFAYSRIPSRRETGVKMLNPLDHLELVRRDKIFQQMLIGWMLMGLGNLMTIPLRAEYLANPAYGLSLSNTEISLLLVTVVAVFRILSTYLWGWLFDRFDLIVTRIGVNICFMINILVFFHAHSFWSLCIGTAMLGVALGGGGIIWQIWVTKVAPPHLVGAYMSIHGGLTGLRTFAAPFLGYALVDWGQPTLAAWVAAGLILASTLLFLPMRGKLPQASGEDLKKAAPGGGAA